MSCKCSTAAAMQQKNPYALLAVLFLGTAAAADRACIDDAARRFDLPAAVLEAVVAQESSGRCPPRHPTNRNGSYDISCAGINSAWLPELRRRFGITEQALQDPCTNVHVGAWILAHNVRRHGNTWRAVGAYNAATESKRRDYAWKIARRMRHAAP